MTDLCAAFGISRKTGYKWLGRYRELGAEGLHDLPRAPLQHGRATAEELVARIVAAKEAHPLWGPRKLMKRLRADEPGRDWPALSTASAILTAAWPCGPASRRAGRRRATGRGRQPKGANAVWTGDHKGWFRTRDGWRCEPLDGDGCVEPLPAGAGGDGFDSGRGGLAGVRAAVRGARPAGSLRSDNGSPFASAGVTGLTPLSVRFVKLGITLERIQPGKPQQNGRHERFHLTMLPLAKAPKADRVAQGQAFDAFRREYNEVRPHEALGMDTPAQHYSPSTRAMPTTPPEPDYPPEAAVRSVRHNGEIRWNGGFVYVSQTLAGEAVAIEETEDGEWALYFYAHPLGIIDTKRMRIGPPQRRANSTAWRCGGHQNGERTVTHVSGTKCYPSIRWTDFIDDFANRQCSGRAIATHLTENSAPWA